MGQVERYGECTGFGIQLTSVGVRIENKQPPLIEGGRTSIREALTAGAREAFKQSKMDPQLIVVILPVSNNIRVSTAKVAKLTDPRERILLCIRRSSTLRVSSSVIIRSTLLTIQPCN